MPVTINGKVIRNVPEQVGKNKRDIHELILSIPTYGKSIELTMDSDYVMTLTLKDAEGHVLSHASVDLPLEATVVDGRFDDDTDTLILVLNNGNEIEIPVSGLISGLVTTDTDQTITGKKTLENDLIFENSTNKYTVAVSNYGNLEISYNGARKFAIFNNNGCECRNTFDPGTNNTYDLGTSSHAWKDIYSSGTVYAGLIRKTDSSLTLQANGAINIAAVNGLRPLDNDYISLGDASHTWKDLYLSRNLTDGTNSVSVADIVNGLINIINAADIVGNTLTQAQYDLITNGKITIIEGTFNNYDNPVLMNGHLESGVYKGVMVNAKIFEYGISFFTINASTKVFSSTREIFMDENGLVSIYNLKNINAKSIPAFPPDTGTFIPKCINGVLTWVEE